MRLICRARTKEEANREELTMVGPRIAVWSNRTRKFGCDVDGRVFPLSILFQLFHHPVKIRIEFCHLWLEIGFETVMVIKARDCTTKETRKSEKWMDH